MRNLSKNIEIHRNPEGLENERSTGEVLYFLRFLFFPSNLHTVEVGGSNPLSPIPSPKRSASSARGPMRKY